MSLILGTYTAGTKLVFTPQGLTEDGRGYEDDPGKSVVTLTAETDGDATLRLPAGHYRVSEDGENWGQVMVSFDIDEVEYLGDTFLTRTPFADVRLAAMLHRVMQSANPVEPTDDRQFTFRQDDAQAVWAIPHDLDRYPTVRVVDSAGSIIPGNVAYDSAHHLTVTFPSAFCGRAFLS